MPIGPNGEKRPAGVIACATHVMRIAVGDVEETYVPTPKGHRERFPSPDLGRGRKVSLEVVREDAGHGHTEAGGIIDGSQDTAKVGQ